MVVITAVFGANVGSSVKLEATSEPPPGVPMTALRLRRRPARQGQGSVRDERSDTRLGSKGRTVRLTPDGFEMQCLACRDFWPLEAAFWPPRAISRCLACHREKTRIHLSALRRKPGVLAEHVARYRAERRARRAA